MTTKVPQRTAFSTIRQLSLETQATESTNKNHHVLHSLFYDLLLLLFSRLATSDSCIPMDCSTPGSSVLHYLLESAHIHVH